MKKTTVLLIVIFLFIVHAVSHAQNCPQGSTQYEFAPVQGIQLTACRQNEVTLGKQSVLWGIKNLTTDTLYVKFTKTVTTTCGKVLKTDSDTYLKPGEFAGSLTFSGENSFEVQVSKEDCDDAKNRIRTVAYEGLTIRNLSEEERKKQEEKVLNSRK